MSLDSLLDRGFLEGDASLQLVDDLLAVALLLLNVFHEVEEDGARLETLFLDLALLLVLKLQDLLLVLHGLLVGRGDEFRGDKVLLHTGQHVLVALLSVVLLVDLLFGFVERVQKHFVPSFKLVGGTLDVEFLGVGLLDLFTFFLEFLLLFIGHFLCLVKLPFDLLQLEGNLAQLLCLVLV